MTVSRMNLKDVYELVMTGLTYEMEEDNQILFDVIHINMFSIGYDDNDQTCYDHTKAIMTVSNEDSYDDFIEQFINKEKTIKTYKRPHAFINAWRESSKHDNEHCFTVYSD